MRRIYYAIIAYEGDGDPGYEDAIKAGLNIRLDAGFELLAWFDNVEDVNKAARGEGLALG